MRKNITSMTNLAINTTQNVNIQFTTAAVGERILACIIDYFVKVAYVIIVFYFLSPVLSSLEDWSAYGLASIILLPVMFYTLILETYMGGQTLGKKWMKIKVVKLDGFEAHFSDFVGRWIFNLIDIYISSGAIAILSIVLSQNNQRLGDMVAGTAVISLKKRLGINQTILEEVQREYVPRFTVAQFLSDKDAHIIKSNMEKALQSQNYELLIALRQKVETILKVEKGQLSDLVFLQIVLKDFNFYTGK